MLFTIILVEFLLISVVIPFRVTKVSKRLRGTSPLMHFLAPSLFIYLFSFLFIYFIFLLFCGGLE